MKESGNVSLHMAYFRSLMSRIEDWGERGSIHVYRSGLVSRPLDQLASHPGSFDTLQDLMDITLNLDTSLSQLLKEALTTAPIISRFNHSLPTNVETDASDYALGDLLSQVNDSGKNPIAFDSHKLLPAELKYEIHEKELLGIVRALKH
ncbi:hypothetical protein O181_088785 [Austropuccinia psidii MF-1]|uniref:Reverse transcriptase/retrotransposon-derived protein RNase H-like domain-containing protein n=1 Tax=Austropuccinia psidii MF-1 TaxID=1389203 RepID=A0A9Q3ISJ2_9BASI|nr:hypothetical protein [Austropuccinia psidii MF-1]